MALIIAAATLLPPLRPLAMIAGRSLSNNASFDSAAPTKPTGAPITASVFNYPCLCSSSNLKIAVGAFPITNNFGPEIVAARSIPAIARVIPFAFACSATSGSAI